MPEKRRGRPRDNYKECPAEVFVGSPLSQFAGDDSFQQSTVIVICPFKTKCEFGRREFVSTGEDEVEARKNLKKQIGGVWEDICYFKKNAGNETSR